MKKGKSRNKRKKTRSRLLWIAIAVIGIAGRRCERKEEEADMLLRKTTWFWKKSGLQQLALY